MHLREGSRGQGVGVDVFEDGVERRREVFLDDSPQRLEGTRWYSIVKLTQCVDEG